MVEKLAGFQPEVKKTEVWDSSRNGCLYLELKGQGERGAWETLRRVKAEVEAPEPMPATSGRYLEVSPSKFGLPLEVRFRSEGDFTFTTKVNGVTRQESYAADFVAAVWARGGWHFRSLPGKPSSPEAMEGMDIDVPVNGGTESYPPSFILVKGEQARGVPTLVPCSVQVKENGELKRGGCGFEFKFPPAEVLVSKEKEERPKFNREERLRKKKEAIAREFAEDDRRRTEAERKRKQEEEVRWGDVQRQARRLLEAVGIELEEIEAHTEFDEQENKVTLLDLDSRGARAIFGFKDKECVFGGFCSRSVGIDQAIYFNDYKMGERPYLPGVLTSKFVDESKGTITVEDRGKSFKGSFRKNF